MKTWEKKDNCLDRIIGKVEEVICVYSLFLKFCSDLKETEKRKIEDKIKPINQLTNEYIN